METIQSVVSKIQSENEKVKEQLEKEKEIQLNLSLEAKQKRSTHPNAFIPCLIEWKDTCPGVLWNFNEQSKPLPAVPAQSQESSVVADLLLVLSGVSGRYITADSSKPGSFLVADGLETCFAEMVYSVLPLAAAFSNVTRFKEKKRAFMHGRVNHALAEGLEKLCNDYIVVIARLSGENRATRLDLHTLYSRVYPYISTFQTLSDVCNKIEGDVRGGKTLTILCEATRQATRKTEQMMQYLLETAAVPYMQQLKVWLTKGVVDDPWSEFLIEDHQVESLVDDIQTMNQKDLLMDEYSESYWVKRYIICKEMEPSFLENYAQTILRTGKYLNVLRQCGLKNVGPKISELRFSCKDKSYGDIINKAHKEASSALLKYIMGEMDLPGHLRSIRNYMLLAQGDLLNKFMDMASKELDKEIMDIVPSRLQSLLELAMRTTAAANSDPYKDLLRVELHQENVLTLLTQISGGTVDPADEVAKGWEGLAFLYTPPWPVSLVLHRSALTLYQLIFRHVVYCRHVERLLLRVWQDHKHREFWSAWDLRHRMLQYVSNLEYYMLVEVIEPHWNLLLKELPNCRDLDDVLECHNRFQTECLTKCMLTNPQHFQVLNTFLRKCVEFCRFMDTCALVEASPVHSASPAISFTPAESFSVKIAEFRNSFTQHVQYLFRTLGDGGAARRSDKLMDMLYRLDFNSYYTTVVSRKASNTSSSRTRNSSKSSNGTFSSSSHSPTHRSKLP